MRYAIISDIHANAEALRAVLASIERQAVDRVICLGDLVGFHADPNFCVEEIARRGIACVRGNHDAVASGLREPSDFSAVARRSVEWTRAELTPENIRYLRELPPLLVMDDCLVAVHAALYPEPNDQARILSTRTAALSFARMTHSFCFYGHTHHWMVFEQSGRQVRLIDRDFIALRDDCRYLINPGTVGQPRGYDLRASYALFDPDRRSVRRIRVSYNHRACQEKAIRADLLPRPRPLAQFSQSLHARLEQTKSWLKQKIPYSGGASARLSSTRKAP